MSPPPLQRRFPKTFRSDQCLDPNLSTLFLRAACICGASVTLLSMIFNLVPIVDVARPWVFALKVGGTVVGINLIATAIYWRGSRGNHAVI
jgi:hypothetical protein